PQIAPPLQTTFWRRAPMGLGRPTPDRSRLRVKEAKRAIVPLSVDEVARFWSSFRTSRDLAIVGLMLLQGLRSREVIALNRDAVLFPGGADPCPWQGKQDPVAALGSRSRPASGSLPPAGATQCPNAAVVRFPEGPRPRRSHDPGRSALFVPASSRDHRR